MVVLKNRNHPEVSEANSEPPRKTQPFKTVAEKYSSNDISIISVHRRKDVYSDHTKKNPKNDRLYVYQSTDKKKDVVAKRLRTRSVADGE